MAKPDRRFIIKTMVAGAVAAATPISVLHAYARRHGPLAVRLTDGTDIVLEVAGQGFTATHADGGTVIDRSPTGRFAPLRGELLDIEDGRVLAVSVYEDAIGGTSGVSPAGIQLAQTRKRSATPLEKKGMDTGHKRFFEHNVTTSQKRRLNPGRTRVNPAPESGRPSRLQKKGMTVNPFRQFSDHSVNASGQNRRNLIKRKVNPAPGGTTAPAGKATIRKKTQ